MFARVAPSNATNSTVAVACAKAQRQLPASQQSGVSSWLWAREVSAAVESTTVAMPSSQCPDPASVETVAVVEEAAMPPWDIPTIDPAVASDPLKITAILSTARSQNWETDIRQVYGVVCNGRLSTSGSGDPIDRFG